LPWQAKNPKLDSTTETGNLFESKSIGTSTKQIFSQTIDMPGWLEQRPPLAFPTLAGYERAARIFQPETNKEKISIATRTIEIAWASGLAWVKLENFILQSQYLR